MFCHCPQAFFICFLSGGNVRTDGLCLAFGEVTELRHGFEFLATDWGPVRRLPNVFHLYHLSVPAYSGFERIPVKVGDRVKLNGIVVVECASLWFPAYIYEVRCCNVDPSLFFSFRILNHVQRHQNPVGKRVLSTWLFPLCPCIASVLSLVSGLFHHLVANLDMM